MALITLAVTVTQTLTLWQRTHVRCLGDATARAVTLTTAGDFAMMVS